MFTNLIHLSRLRFKGTIESSAIRANIEGPLNVAQTVKRLSVMQETRVQSLGWEDPLEKEMTAHSSTVALKIPWMEQPGRLQSMGSQRVP